MSRGTVLVTGAGGFIGRALCTHLAEHGNSVRALLRNPAQTIGFPGQPIEPVPAGTITPDTDWAPLLERVNRIVHLANRAHRPPGEATVDLGLEAASAARLVRAAAERGVRRIVHMSSIKVMGERTAPGTAFRAEDTPLPADAYGRAKLATEAAMQQAAHAGNGVELVILRPPLVYGPGVGANFRALARLAASGIPLPFAGIRNRRSLIALGNLVDLVACALAHPAAPGKILLARDATDLSTPELLTLLAAACGTRPRLFRVPKGLFRIATVLPKAGPALARLTQSLQADDSETRALLDWSPPLDTAQALQATARSMIGARLERTRP